MLISFLQSVNAEGRRNSIVVLLTACRLATVASSHRFILRSVVMGPQALADQRNNYATIASSKGRSQLLA